MKMYINITQEGVKKDCPRCIKRIESFKRGELFLYLYAVLSQNVANYPLSDEI